MFRSVTTPPPGPGSMPASTAVRISPRPLSWPGRWLAPRILDGVIRVSVTPLRPLTAGWGGRSVVYRVGKHPEVAAAAAAGGGNGADGIHWSVGSAGLTYRFGQRGEII